MLKREKNLILVVILFFVSLVLISAFVIEYGFDHQPCKLCLYERIPYFLSILLIIKIFFIKKYERVTLFVLSLIFIGSTTLSFYHFGIEQGFIKESLVCDLKVQTNSLTKEDLLKELKTKKTIIQTKAGLLNAFLKKNKEVSVDIGKAYFKWNQIPLKRKMNTNKLNFKINNFVNPFAVNVGNPHVVFFIKDLKKI